MVYEYPLHPLLLTPIRNPTASVLSDNNSLNLSAALSVNLIGAARRLLGFTAVLVENVLKLLPGNCTKVVVNERWFLFLTPINIDDILDSRFKIALDILVSKLMFYGNRVNTLVPYKFIMINVEELQKELLQLSQEEAQIEQELANYVQALVGGNSDKARTGSRNKGKWLYKPG
jgi:hypothetical protein